MPTFTKYLERNLITDGSLSAMVSKRAWNAALSSVVMNATEEMTEHTDVGELKGITLMSSHATKLMVD